MTRVLSIIGWGLTTLVMGFGFAVFGWTAANIPPPPTSPEFPLPPEVWTWAMVIVAISCLLSSVWTLFAMLDSFLDRHDPRRVVLK